MSRCVGMVSSNSFDELNQPAGWADNVGSAFVYGLCAAGFAIVIVRKAINAINVPIPALNVVATYEHPGEPWHLVVSR